jgi:hypothetical protein
MIGHLAGYANTTGVNNTFVGDRAGFSNTIGLDNTFIGRYAGNANSSGLVNTFVGTQAGYSNTTGSYNVFLGFDAGHSNTAGFSNTFMGTGAGYSNTTGDDNTFLGDGAGYSNTTGVDNLFIGRSTGRSNTTGFENTFIGFAAGYSNSTGSNNVFIGHEAGLYETESNKLYIANGRDSTDVLIYGDFSTPRIGIGTVSPGYTVDIAGECHATNFPTSSDARLKENVSQLTDVLDKLERIRGVSFDWNALYESFGRSSGHKEIGVIAQEVEAVFPELVTSWGKEEYRAVDYGRLTGVLIEAIKELRAENQALKKRVEALEVNTE